MANPQLENGYVRIANELCDAMMATEFTGREFRTLLAIIRYSYGWNKKEAYLTVKQIHQVTGLSEYSTVSKVLRRLITKNVLIQCAPDIYQLNKDYARWQMDGRRYKPLEKQTNDFGKADQKNWKSEPKFLEKQTKKLSSETPKKLDNGDDLSDVAHGLHKDIFKDIYKDISLRERIFERLKESLSGINPSHLRALVNRHPERADFFLYLCETFKVDPVYVKNPVAYITSLRPISFPDYNTRRKKEEERVKELETAKAQREEMRRQFYEGEEFHHVGQMVKEFIDKIN